MDPKPTPMDFKKFGAVGDGVTDDTAAIQRAIDDYRRRSQSKESSSLNELHVAHSITTGPPSD